MYSHIFLLFRADEVKEHSFFAGMDWQQVYLQKYTPPLIPPRGEVNAADAFDIGSFDEEDTKGIRVGMNPFFASLPYLPSYVTVSPIFDNILFIVWNIVN